MTLLADARRLLGEMDPSPQGMCLFCLGVERDGPNTPTEHKATCVYLRRDHIIAALEAAEDEAAQSVR